MSTSLSMPATRVELSCSALLHNLHEFQRLSKSVAPVVKSNAYGHGIGEIVAMLEDEPHIPFFVVDSIDEAKAVRAAGLQVPLLTIGYVSAEEANDESLGDIAFTLVSTEMLEEWCCKIVQPTRVHLKIDTGMYRQGIVAERVDTAFSRIAQSPQLLLEGLCTHLADADSSDTAFTERQIELWNRIARTHQARISTLKHFHVSNTPGHAYGDKIFHTVSRLGIGLYGIAGNGAVDAVTDLRPVLKVITRIVALKDVPIGAPVGYNGTYRPIRLTRIAILPIGYGAGIRRRLSNNGVVTVAGHEAPVVGRVCMNLTSVDVTDAHEASCGSEVIVISDLASVRNSVMSIAKSTGTIAHEVLTAISPLLPRIVVP